MKHCQIFCQKILIGLTTALPGGCGGTLGIVSTNSSTVPQLWTCSSIDPSSLFGSGDNQLLATYEISSDAYCTDVCAPWMSQGLIVALWYHN
jgi:hypothetical protein